MEEEARRILRHAVSVTAMADLSAAWSGGVTGSVDCVQLLRCPSAGWRRSTATSHVVRSSVRTPAQTALGPLTIHQVAGGGL